MHPCQCGRYVLWHDVYININDHQVQFLKPGIKDVGTQEGVFQLFRQ